MKPEEIILRALERIESKVDKLLNGFEEIDEEVERTQCAACADSFPDHEPECACVCHSDELKNI